MLSACGSPAAEESLDNRDLDIVGGPLTYDVPAVGQLSVKRDGQTYWCTATAISSRVILTSAHCFHYMDTKSGLARDGKRPKFSSSDNGTFVVEHPTRAYKEERVVGRFAVLDSKDQASTDLAVAELKDDLPDWVTPLEVARKVPEVGSSVFTVGYGGTKRVLNKDTGKIAGEGSLLKRRFDWTWSGFTFKFADPNDLQSPGMAPGDSGGPVLDSKGRIVGVNSRIVGTKRSGSPGSYSFKSFEGVQLTNAVAARGWIQPLAALYGRYHSCDTCQEVTIATHGDFWVSAEGGGGGEVNANRLEPRSWETFRLVPLGGRSCDTCGDKFFALQTKKGHFLSSWNAGAGKCDGGAVRAELGWLYECETFEWVDGFQGGVGIKTWNGHYWSAVNGGGGSITTGYDWVHDWETFSLRGPGGTLKLD